MGLGDGSESLFVTHFSERSKIRHAQHINTASFLRGQKVLAIRLASSSAYIKLKNNSFEGTFITKPPFYDTPSGLRKTLGFEKIDRKVKAFRVQVCSNEQILNFTRNQYPSHFFITLVESSAENQKFRFEVIVLSQSPGNHGYGFMAYNYTWLSVQMDQTESKMEIVAASDVYLERYDFVELTHIAGKIFLKFKSWIYGSLENTSKMNGLIQLVLVTPEHGEEEIDSFEGSLIQGHEIIKDPETGNTSVKIYYVVVRDFK